MHEEAEGQRDGSHLIHTGDRNMKREPFQRQAPQKLKTWLLFVASSLSHLRFLLLGGFRGNRRRRKSTQRSTLSAQPNFRRTWTTCSGRPPKKPWPSTENRGSSSGRRNASFSEGGGVF